jgi:dTDP-4-amino-4,6-dideoxygalactose transaminase
MIELPHTDSAKEHVWHQFVIRTEKRDELMKYFSPDTLALYNRYIKELSDKDKNRMEALIYSTYISI